MDERPQNSKTATSDKKKLSKKKGGLGVAGLGGGSRKGGRGEGGGRVGWKIKERWFGLFGWEIKK